MQYTPQHRQYIAKSIDNQNAKLIAQNTNIYKDAFKQTFSIITKTLLFVIPVVALAVVIGGVK